MTEITTFPNGFRVATDAMPHLETAAVGVWVDAGARHETAAESGVSHMLEHMAFKGTERRDARRIAEEIEAVGGYLNAYTGREQTAYYARVLQDDVPLALDIVADILQHSVFDETELAREKGVVLQELGQAKDTPDDIVFDHLQSACYPDQPMGRPILGDETTVSSFSRADLAGYMGRRYRTGGMALIAAGAVDHAALVRLAEEKLGALEPGGRPDAEPARFAAREFRGDDDLEQVHVTLGFEGVPIGSDDAWAAQVFAAVLGGGMSSRLFQEVREKRGLVYAVQAFSQHWLDSGLIGVYAGTGPGEIAELMPVVAGELAAVAEGATEEETARARAQLKAGLLMSRESPSSRCDQIATHLAAFGRVLSVAEMVRKLDEVDAAAVRRFATALLGRGGVALAALGPIGKLESRDRFEARLR